MYLYEVKLDTLVGYPASSKIRQTEAKDSKVFQIVLAILQKIDLKTFESRTLTLGIFIGTSTHLLVLNFCLLE